MKVTVILLLAGVFRMFLFVIVHRTLVLHVVAGLASTEAALPAIDPPTNVLVN